MNQERDFSFRRWDASSLCRPLIRVSAIWAPVLSFRYSRIAAFSPSLMILLNRKSSVKRLSATSFSRRISARSSS